MNAGKKRGMRVSIVELIALSIVVAVITLGFVWQLDDKHLYFSKPGLAELEPLRKYGPDRSSQYYEEWVIRDFFKDRREGVFLDVGANHYQRDSTTYFLETNLGWSGLAIEPQTQFREDYAKHRPRTRFIAMFASDVVDKTVTLYVPDENRVASSNKEFSGKFGTPGGGAPTEVPTTTLNAVLDQAKIQRLDFLSMDIELAEPKALAGFDIERFQPALVCIEAHREVRQQILDYFVRHGYTLVGDYLRVDPHNLYFQPLK